MSYKMPINSYNIWGPNGSCPGGLPARALGKASTPPPHSDMDMDTARHLRNSDGLLDDTTAWPWAPQARHSNRC